MEQNNIEKADNIVYFLFKSAEDCQKFLDRQASIKA